jgi:hypothetical protein
VELWIGPAIVAAAVSSIVTAAGWFVTSWQSQRLERTRRDEKIRDFQIALRAEIDSDLLNLAESDFDALQLEVAERLTANAADQIVVPHLAANMVFDTVVKEIHVLPEDVIGPVIRYARMRHTIARFTEDLRASNTQTLAAARRIAMFSDFFGMMLRLRQLAEDAVAALDDSLSKRGAGQPNLSSASGPGGASALLRDGP